MRGSTGELRRFFESDLAIEMAPATRVLDELIKLQVEIAQSQARAAPIGSNDAVWALVFVAIAVLATGGVLAYAAIAVHVGIGISTALSKARSGLGTRLRRHEVSRVGVR